MKNTFAAMILGTTLAIPIAAVAQTSPQAGRVDISIIPAGTTVFTENNDVGEPSFHNYDAGAGIALALNKRFSIEGELSGSFGVSQELTFATIEQELTPPNMLHYTGNVSVNLATEGTLIPFLTAGAGGLTVFERADIIQRHRTFFATNTGAGVKWRAGRWGLRADYRFMRIEGRETTFAPNERPRPDFFGKDTRYAHRLFGGIMLTIN